MNIWQSTQWNEMLTKTKQVEKIIKIGDIYIQKRRVSLGEYGLFCMGIKDLTGVVPKKLQDLCRAENALFLQIETLNYNNSPLSSQERDWGGGLIEKIKGFKEGHYKKFITPYTALIDLSKTQEEILAGMKPKGRYNIKLAKKKGVTVEIVEKNKKNIQIYSELANETTLRDNFSGHAFPYYEKFLSVLPESKLLLAYKDEVAIAGGIFVFSSETSIYYYGASSSKKEFRNLMAPYLLQWTAICHAKTKKSQLYDFLGVNGEGKDFDPNLKGVTDFKLKLTKNTTKVSESFIFINKKIKFSIIKIGKQLQRIRK